MYIHRSETLWLYSLFNAAVVILPYHAANLVSLWQSCAFRPKPLNVDVTRLLRKVTAATKFLAVIVCNSSHFVLSVLELLSQSVSHFYWAPWGQTGEKTKSSQLYTDASWAPLVMPTGSGAKTRQREARGRQRLRGRQRPLEQAPGTARKKLPEPLNGPVKNNQPKGKPLQPLHDGAASMFEPGRSLGLSFSPSTDPTTGRII